VDVLGHYDVIAGRNVQEWWHVLHSAAKRCAIIAAGAYDGNPLTVLSL
jgi:hypothetical protein